MIFEQFSQGTSLLHRTDARVKILGAMILTLVISLCRNYPTALAGLYVSLTLLLLSNLRLHQVLWRLLMVNGFIAFLWLTLPLTYPGDAIPFGPIHLSRQGIDLVTLITIKTNAIILIFITMLATSTVADLGHGMAKLRLPTKLCLLLLFCYRYIFVVNQEYQRLVRAAKLRCFQPGTNLHTYRTYGHLFGMTLVKSWNRANRVGQAMMLRGFQGRFYSLNEQLLTKSDALLLVTLFITVIGLIVLEFV